MPYIFDSEENLKILREFFEYVVFGVLDSIVTNFIEEAPIVREKVFPYFKERVEGKISEALFKKRVEKILADLKLDEALQTYVFSVFETFASQLYNELEEVEHKLTPEDLERVTDEYIVVRWFDKQVLDPGYRILMLDSVGYSEALETRAKILELFKSFISKEVSFEEAKHALEKMLEGFRRKEVVLGVKSLVLAAMETIKMSNIHKMAEHIKKEPKTISAPVSSFLPSSDKKSKLFNWFREDIVKPALKNLAANLISDEKQDLERGITESFILLMDRVLTFNDFEKRIAALIKPEIKSEPARTHVAASLLSIAELVYEEAEEDPSLESFIDFIETRQKEINRIYG
ncbi:MAG: hypothetical protein QXR19_05210 [Candidatus Jordarchaeaceae archaeon]